MQTIKLAFQLFPQVGQARQVFMGTADAVFGFAAALLVLGDTGGLLDKVTQVFRLGFDQLADHALLDDRIAARAQTSTKEDVSNVAATAFGAVKEIGVLAVAGDPAADRYFVVAGVFTGQGAVGVVENQLDGGLGHRLAGIGAVEDDVGHRLATQVLRRALTHHPAHGVDDVRLAATVRPNHCRHITGEGHRGWVNK